jgi:hypothetical protein
MTAPELMPDCPTEETLAAFVDNLLDPEQRRIVVAHLATCGACRELVMMTTEFQTSNVEPFVRRSWWPQAAAGVAAAAAIVGFLMLRPTDMDRLGNAWASLEKRPMEARLAADLPYLEATGTPRGPGDEKSPDGSNAGAYSLADETKDPHFRGIALLLTGEREFLASAIDELKKAQVEAQADERDAIDLDLAAALLRRGTDDDVKQALSLSDDVWKRKHLPVAAWNRAVAIHMLSSDDDARAVKAWQDYLAVDSTSKWAGEARQKIKWLEDF